MHDAQIRVAIAGAGGRMGRQLFLAALQMGVLSKRLRVN